MNLWGVLSCRVDRVASCFCRGFHVRGVTHLAFSPDGNKLLSVGADVNHSVAVYNLTKTGVCWECVTVPLPAHRLRTLPCPRCVAAWLWGDRAAGDA
jgi:hypothetical protein